MKKLISVVLVLGSCVAVACSSSSDDSGGSAGSSNGTGGSGTGGSGAGRTGITPCGNFPDQVAKSCQASQYCQDEGFSKCAAGCLSDNNCTENQTCIKAGGANEGTCQTKSTGGGGSGTGGATGGSACDGTAFADACKLCSLSPMCADPNFCKQLGEPCASCVVTTKVAGCQTVATACKAQCGL